MDDYLTVQQAAELMGVSRFTIWRRIRTGELSAYRAGVDRRVKLVKRRDVEELMLPRPFTEHQGKAAA